MHGGVRLIQTRLQAPLCKKRGWCSREESNLHGFPHTVLSRTRLPFRHVSVIPESHPQGWEWANVPGFKTNCNRQFFSDTAFGKLACPKMFFKPTARLVGYSFKRAGLFEKMGGVRDEMQLGRGAHPAHGKPVQVDHHAIEFPHQ